MLPIEKVLGYGGEPYRLDILIYVYSVESTPPVARITKSESMLLR
jgi:hypothetical protein